MRSREVPMGTVGGRIAATHQPRSNRWRESAIARAASPSTNGWIAVIEGDSGIPSCAAPLRNRAMFDSKRRRCSGSLWMIANAARAAAAIDGGGAVENTQLRARWIRYSISASEPATNAPAAPRLLPSVAT